MSQTRRHMLRTGGAVLMGGLIGAVTVSSTAQQASAASADLEISDESVTVRGQEPESLWLDLNVGWAYALPSGETPDTATVELLAAKDGDEPKVVDSESESVSFLEADGDVSFEVDLIDAGVLSVDELLPSEPGDEQSVDIEISVAFEVEDTDGLPVAVDSETETTTVTIKESEYDASEYADVAGTGGLTVELA